MRTTTRRCSLLKVQIVLTMMNSMNQRRESVLYLLSLLGIQKQVIKRRSCLYSNTLSRWDESIWLQSCANLIIILSNSWISTGCFGHSTSGAWLPGDLLNLCGSTNLDMVRLLWCPGRRWEPGIWVLQLSVLGLAIGFGAFQAVCEFWRRI